MTEWSGLNDFQRYWVDAWQRSILSLDVLRQRANIHREQTAKEVPNVLGFQVELVRDGRTLERPVNYGLVRIVPPPGVEIDPAKPPMIVVDPRAGHGPGIGGMKKDSQIGMALAAGHPCYFVGFSPKPIPEQTVEDVCRAEAVFIEDVAARHHAADGKPVVIANCQAGWQIMMTAALRPELTGPIMLAGSPLSYWAGVRGKNPMRYLGGLLGGTWMTALAGDLGNGIFDGANLVANFESLNPANTFWTKGYNVYSKVDTEVERFLDFETWWGSPVLLNAREMQWIADNLFVGNKLSTGQLRTSDGARIDLRNIRSPIIVFCSWGDNITPPQQALDWILDLYNDDREIIESGQTIVYTMHHSIGHLGIFVSGKVATREHREFVSCMDMIDALPPGLYEAVITDVGEDTANRNLIHGRYLFQLETRTLDHIRAIGGNDAADDRRFATAGRVSEINHGLYETFVAPALRGRVPEPAAELLRAAHPHRVRFAMFGDENPFMRPVKQLADSVRADRQPVNPDNPWLGAQELMSSWVTTYLHACGEWRDTLSEMTFLNIYGSPLLQALAGLGPQVPATHQQIERDLMRESAAARAEAELKNRFDTGHIEEAVIRSLVYINRADGMLDERGFTTLKQIRESRPPEKRMSMARFKEILREQFMLVWLDEERAIKALPVLIGDNTGERKLALDVIRRVVEAKGVQSDEGQRRLARIEKLFAAGSKSKQLEPAGAAND
jgi:hypothetical protein